MNTFHGMTASVLAILMFAAGTAMAAAPALPPVPLKVTATLDRGEYLQLEPMLIDVGLTNTGKEEIDFIKLGAGWRIWIEAFDKAGKALKPMDSLPFQSVLLAGTAEEISLRPGQAARGWVDISTHYLWEPGEYTVRVTHAAEDGYRLPGFASKAASTEIALRVRAAPAGSEDAKAAELVSKRWLRTKSSVAPFRSYPELRKAVLETTKSGRFGSVARFYEVRKEMENLMSSPADIVMDEMAGSKVYIAKAKERVADPLREVMKGEATTPYLKGFCAWRILVIRMAYDLKLTRPEAAAEARRIAREHPDTYSGWQADLLVRKLQDDAKTPLWELSRKVEWY
jgi:hypothetical protein